MSKEKGCKRMLTARGSIGTFFLYCLYFLTLSTPEPIRNPHRGYWSVNEKSQLKLEFKEPILYDLRNGIL